MTERIVEHTRAGMQSPATSDPDLVHDNGNSSQERVSWWADVVSPAGYILAVSYPVLALSTGARALYQLFIRSDIENYLPVYLSAVAAVLYLVATIGFAYRRRWTWWLSLSVLALETALTLVVGVWSIVDPELIGSTVWRRFGEDYGYFPLFQPLLGLAWLLWPQTMRLYGIRNADRTQATGEYHES